MTGFYGIAKSQTGTKAETTILHIVRNVLFMSEADLVAVGKKPRSLCGVSLVDTFDSDAGWNLCSRCEEISDAELARWLQ